MSKATRVGSAANLGHVLAACHDRQPGGTRYQRGTVGPVCKRHEPLRATLGYFFLLGIATAFAAVVLGEQTKREFGLGHLLHLPW